MAAIKHVCQLLSLRSIFSRTVLKRNFGVSVVVVQKIQDPIQKLFVEKLKEYTQKSKSQGGGLVDASPDTQKQMKEELEKIEIQYGGGKGIDLSKFPTFNFKDPEIDPINMEGKH
ncbi:ATP synthase-coupling factor 6, mitochondrial-like [Tachypleus tridentatus]|uniref:ATP synthase-coupling factor 6, mitochondrial-like n=1 Tax=Tachypleus tridentatus TaxID=6853 RepID=UPI003FD0D841